MLISTVPSTTTKSVISPSKLSIADTPVKASNSVPKSMVTLSIPEITGEIVSGSGVDSSMVTLSI